MDTTYAPAPYRIKMVEPIRQTTREERVTLLENAGYNPFSLKSEDVYIDLLTDSGTGAMSQEQWAALMRGDEAYAGSRSFYRLESIVKHITGYRHFMPAHQGRGAEQVVIPALVDETKNIMISNMHFDTTRAHVEIAGARAIDCACDEAMDTDTYHPFKGNFNLDRLNELLKTHEGHVAGIIMTITNNSAGGQPVSMENLRAVRDMARAKNIPLVIDGARYAENAFYVKEREQGYADKSILEIAREAFSYADIFLMSAKKDGLVNMGGVIAIKDDPDLFRQCQSRGVPMEGFTTYGGMSGRDMDALAVGLEEALDIHYLRHRTDQVRYLGDRLKDAGVPIQYPTGGHAVFVDVAKILPDIPYHQFPAQSFVNQLYIESGVRAVEIGSFLMGRNPDTGENVKSPFEFMRLTIPRRTYTYKQLDHVADGVIKVYHLRDKLKGMRLTYEPPVLRHFTARLEPME